MTSSWQNFTTRIPSVFFNSTLRFSLLRIVCVSAFVLIWNVPTDTVTIVFGVISCRHPGTPSFIIPDSVSKYERWRMIYSYLLYAFTLLHHFSSAFGPKLSLPGVLDFTLIVGEIILFMLRATTGRWAAFILRLSECGTEYSYSKITTIMVGFMWAVSISLLLLAIMRVAEALESNGRYIWTTYDITGLKRMPKCAQVVPTETGKRLNGVQVLTGVQLWEAHFNGEGKCIVLPRGIIAFVFVAVVLVFTFSAVIVDPMHESDEVPVKIGMSRRYPSECNVVDMNVVVVGLARGPIDLGAASVRVSSPDIECEISSKGYLPTAGVPFRFINFLCKNYPKTVSVQVNFTRVESSINLMTRRMDPVQVMIGYSNHTDISRAIIRRTEVPALLMPGMNILGFAHQHKVRLFRNRGLSTFGLFASSDEFVLSEITNIQPNYQASLSSNDTASLLIIPRTDFSDIKVIQDYRDKSVLKGFSSAGGLWTVLSFIFGVLFGSSLVRVAFGAKPLSIFGLAHNAMREETQQKYRDAYPLLESDMEKLRANRGLMALLINHLVDPDLLQDANKNLPDDFENPPRL